LIGCLTVNKVLTFVAMVFFTFPAFAQKRMYVDDNNQVPLRTGQGLEYRVIHKGVNAGTAVEVLETDNASGHSRVREPGGVEGWLPTRFLTAQPIARDRLQKMESELQKIKEANARLIEEHKASTGANQTLVDDHNRLATSNRELTEELQHIKRISENAIALDKRNQELRESNQTLQNDVDFLTAENRRLKDNSETNTMLVGAGLMGTGMIIALILPLLRPRKKNSWA
jgi:SH3 domain protein